MQILNVILLSALCIVANAKLAMRISNSIGDGKNAKFYYCRHFMKPSKSERPASIKFVSSYPKVEETIKVTSTRLPRRLTASLRLCWRLKLSEKLDLPKGHYSVTYLNADGKAIESDSVLHKYLDITEGREPPEPPKPAPFVYVSDLAKELLTYTKKDTMFPSAYSTAEPKELPRLGQLEAALDRAIPFTIVDTVYTDLEFVTGDTKRRMARVVFAKGPNGVDVVIWFVRKLSSANIALRSYVNEREALFKLGRLLQYDDVNLFLVSPRIFGISLESKINDARPSDYQKLLDTCLRPILELNQLGIAKSRLWDPRDFLIDDEQKCHALDFGQTYKLREGNQEYGYTKAFSWWWDKNGPLRPYYPIENLNFVPTSEKKPETEWVFFSVDGRYRNEDEEQDAVLHANKYLNYDISHYFGFKSGFDDYGQFPIFDNFVAVHSKTSGVLASDKTSGHILTPKIKGNPLSMYDEATAKKIWTNTITSLHEKSILVGHISSSNIVVDEQGRGHLLDSSYSIVMVQPFIEFSPKLVQEKVDLEMEFLKHLQENCPTNGKSTAAVCNYVPADKHLAVAGGKTIKSVIESATREARQIDTVNKSTELDCSSQNHQ